MKLHNLANVEIPIERMTCGVAFHGVQGEHFLYYIFSQVSLGWSIFTEPLETDYSWSFVPNMRPEAETYEELIIATLSRFRY